MYPSAAIVFRFHDSHPRYTATLPSPSLDPPRNAARRRTLDRGTRPGAAGTDQAAGDRLRHLLHAGRGRQHLHADDGRCDRARRRGRRGLDRAADRGRHRRRDAAWRLLAAAGGQADPAGHRPVEPGRQHDARRSDIDSVHVGACTSAERISLAGRQAFRL